MKIVLKVPPDSSGSKPRFRWPSACLSLSLLIGCGGQPASAEYVAPRNLAQPIADLIVVVGKRPPLLKDGSMNPELEHRVRFGAELYRRGYAPRMLMSGGPSKVGVEAEHMRRAAVRYGVPEAAILTEGASRDTIENARFSRAVACAEGSCLDRVILVSNAYHTHRATRLFRCAGFEVTPMPAPLTSRKTTNRRYERRVAFLYAFIDECQRAGPR